MSVTQIVRIKCDGCGDTFEAKESTVLEAEKQAIENGWSEKHGNHYCQNPTCK